MITMIENALVKREAAQKNKILPIVASKVERIEELKKKLEGNLRFSGGFFRGYILTYINLM